LFARSRGRLRNSPYRSSTSTLPGFTVAFSVLLLMTLAALHRIAFHGEDDASFFKIGSALVVASSVPLASGIAGDVAVVFF
jgi:hypothetical protein